MEIKQKINAIDLDHTLLPYDSFRMLIMKELKRFNIYTLLYTAIRSLRLISPGKFKEKIAHRLEIKYDELFFENYGEMLCEEFDLDVVNLIEKETNSNTINVLISASPDAYVKYIIRKLKWQGKGSYKDTQGHFNHLYGQTKVSWILENYDREKYAYNFAISDSLTDNDLLNLFDKKRIWKK